MKKLFTRLLSAILVFSMVTVALVSCAPDPREAKYNDALAMIDSGNYTDAYEILKDLGDYKDTAKHLDRFVFFLTKLTYDLYDRAGVMTTTLGRFNLPSNMISVADIGTKDGTYTYDEQGNLKRQEVNIDGLIAAFDYTYDENNRLIKAEYSENGVVSITHEYPQNEMGLNAKDIYTVNGEVAYDATYTYDEQGRKIRMEYISEIYGSCIDTFTYDEKGNLIEEKSVSLDGSETYYHYTYTYDESGKLASGVYIHGEERYTGRFEYDAAGNVTLDEYTNEDGTKDEYTKEYDEHGNLIHAVWKYANGEVETADYEYTLTYLTVDVPASTMEQILGLLKVDRP